MLSKKSGRERAEVLLVVFLTFVAIIAILTILGPQIDSLVQRITGR